VQQRYVQQRYVQRYLDTATSWDKQGKGKVNFISHSWLIYTFLKQTLIVKTGWYMQLFAYRFSVSGAVVALILSIYYEIQVLIRPKSRGEWHNSCIVLFSFLIRISYNSFNNAGLIGKKVSWHLQSEILQSEILLPAMVYFAWISCWVLNRAWIDW
jgi:hypothetical protein